MEHGANLSDSSLFIWCFHERFGGHIGPPCLGCGGATWPNRRVPRLRCDLPWSQDGKEPLCGGIGVAFPPLVQIVGLLSARDPMKNKNRSIRGYWRGGQASLSFLAGAPFMFAKVAQGHRDPDEARHLITNHFARFLDKCRINVSVEGKVPAPGEGCVISHNETSFADVAAYFVAIWPHVDRLAGADLYAYFPFARAACRRVDIELVARGNRKSTDPLVSRMAQAVQQGHRVGWGAEGRLSGRDGVGRFKVGGSLIAIRAQAPVVPVVIHGGHQAMPLGSFRARSGDIRIRFCDPVPTKGYTEADAREFADKVQVDVARTYQEMSPRRRVP